MCAKALETDTYAITYNWEGTLPEANDRPIESGPNVKIDSTAGWSRWEEFEREWF